MAEKKKVPPINMKPGLLSAAQLAEYRERYPIKKRTPEKAEEQAAKRQKPEKEWKPSADYKCDTCKITGHKLWCRRGEETKWILLCANCAMKEEDIKWPYSIVVEDGSHRTRDGKRMKNIGRFKAAYPNNAYDVWHKLQSQLIINKSTDQ
jgi:hypothetical protein